MMRRLLLLCFLAFIGLLLSACEPPATIVYSSTTADPTNTPHPAPEPSPTHTPLVISAPPLKSGGLGLSKALWETEHSPGEIWAGYTNYDGGKYSIIFIEEKIGHLERNFSGQLPTLAEAHDEAEGLIPEDSQLMETYSPAAMPELIVDLYMSQSLQTCFSRGAFVNGDPGNFIAVYGVFEGKVPRIVIGLGNNP